MKIISFAWTTPALLAGAKTVTRRHWKPGYAARFKAGDFILAYDKSPRAHGRPVAIIRLIQAPHYESLAKMPDADFQAEGFGYLAMHGWRKVGSMRDSLVDMKEHFEQSHREGYSMWVVRFDLIARLDHLPKDHAGYVAGEIERAARGGEAACVFCGCRDSSACINGCAWLEVDYRRGGGVCSNHPAARPVLAGPDASPFVFAQGESSPGGSDS